MVENIASCVFIYLIHIFIKAVLVWGVEVKYLHPLKSKPTTQDKAVLHILFWTIPFSDILFGLYTFCKWFRSLPPV